MTHTDDYLRRLAVDIHVGRAFSSRQLPPEQIDDLLPKVFVVLNFLLSQERAKWIQEDQPVVLYEYLERAGPRGINGYPVFLSMRWLNQADCERLDRYIGRLREAEAAVIGDG